MKYALLPFLIGFMLPKLEAQNVNFSEDIAPIIYNKCSSCHRPNEIGPMPFTNYAEVAPYALTIAAVVNAGLMPPWPPDPNYTHLVGERVLTAQEKQMLNDWAQQGAPQGDPSLEPPLPNFPNGSVLGVPDMVLSMAESYTTNGNNQDDYRIFVLPTGLTQDREIKAIEFRPGNKRVVHHALFASDLNGQGQMRDAQEPGYGYTSFGDFGVPTDEFYGGWAPGLLPTFFPSGTGQVLKAGADLLMQVHYAPYPFVEEDSSYVNIFFADQPIQREVQNYEYAYLQLVIAPDQIKTVKRFITVPTDKSLIGFLPHAHLIGASWKLYYVDPLGDTSKVLHIPKWDFNWQGLYKPTHMMKVPGGSRFYLEATYDNTSANPNNPNSPPITMTWGEGTEDEMFYCILQFVDYQTGDENISLASSIGRPENQIISAQVLQVYPNPTAAELMVKLYLRDKGVMNWQITDLQGRTVNQSSNELMMMDGVHTLRLPVANLSSGQYVLQLAIGEEVLHRTFLKQ